MGQKFHRLVVSLGAQDPGSHEGSDCWTFFFPRRRREEGLCTGQSEWTACLYALAFAPNETRLIVGCTCFSITNATPPVIHAVSSSAAAAQCVFGGRRSERGHHDGDRRCNVGTSPTVLRGGPTFPSLSHERFGSSGLQIALCRPSGVHATFRGKGGRFQLDRQDRRVKVSCLTRIFFSPHDTRNHSQCRRRPSSPSTASFESRGGSCPGWLQIPWRPTEKPSP